MDGGIGADILVGGVGADTALGGAGDDTYFYEAGIDGADQVDLGEGALDQVVVTGAAGQIRLTFTSTEVGNGNVRDSRSQANQDGGLGVRLQTEGSGDALTGAVARFDDEGVIFISGSGGLTFDVRDLVNGAQSGNQFSTVILGTSGGDQFTVAPAPVGLSQTAAYINAGGGNDGITGGSGNDFLVGGAGNDLIGGRAGNDDILGGDGDDFVGGEAGNDSINGGAGNDVLFGDAGNDLIGGGDGNDAMFGQDGDDFMGGEAGNDHLDGNAGNDVLFGDAGNDNILGGAGNDALFGQDGDDTLIGQAGNDEIDGGAGTDTALFSGARSAYTITTTGRLTTVTGPDGTDRLLGVERLQFGDQVVTITTSANLGDDEAAMLPDDLEASLPPMDGFVV